MSEDERFELYDLRVTVDRIEGRSVCGLEVGDYFELTESSRLRIPEGASLLRLRAAGRAAAAAREAARPRGGRLARAGLVRLLPRSRGAPDHADRADRPAHAGDARPDLTCASSGSGCRATGRSPTTARSRALAEAAGFASVCVFNDLWFQPPLPALLEIARATTRVRVGPTCLNPFTSHPVEIAGQIAMLDEASQGRAFLGLASGAWLDELGIAQERPVTAVREAWEVVRRLLAGDAEGFAGHAVLAAAGPDAALPARATGACRS